MILAGIEIGTNTIRLLIADVGPGSFREIASGRIISRLGQDIDRTGLLSQDAQERSLAVLGEFAVRIASQLVAAVSAVGTSALRNAGNGNLFLCAVKNRTGLDLRVISGDEEARLTLLGVRRALSPVGRKGEDPLDSALVMDIGGGSTELVTTRKGSAVHVQSLHLGAVYLTDRYITSDPPAARDVDAIRATVRRELGGWEMDLKQSAKIDPRGLHTVAGTAGTITTLAAMDMELERYDPARISGHVLSRLSIDRMVRALSVMPLKQRRTLAGLESGREDIILAGAIVCQEIMELCGKQDLLVSDWGLREGIVLDLYEGFERHPL